MKATPMKIGKYTLERQEDEGGDLIWIYLTDDGEGMATSEERLEALFDEFYKENF